MKKPTIYDIKAMTLENAPFYFTRDTLKYFGQTMKSFTVAQSPKGNVYIYAPIYTNSRDQRRFMGYSFRQVINNDLKILDCDDSLMTKILTYIHNN